MGAAAVVDPDGDGRGVLFVCSRGGDRLWRCAANGTFTDVTAGLGLRSKSAAAVWGDFAGRGRLSLLSWHPAGWTLWQRAPAGAFEPKALSIDAKGPCLGLSVLDGEGAGGPCVVVASTPNVPLLLRPRAGGRCAAAPLVSDAAAYGRARARLGRAAACLVADLDGDGAADVLQPFEKGALVFPARPAGRFGRVVACGPVGTGLGRARAFVGDYDADGLLDVFVAGESGCRLWQNRGRLRFQEAMQYSGEAAYITKPAALGGGTCDINNDGRQDVLVHYADRPPHLFFNRGFRSFGHAHGLDVQENELLAQADKGTRAGVVADLNGDGAQDMVTVLPDGEVWAFFRETAGVPACSLRVALPARGPVNGPVTVTGWQGKRCLGAWPVVRGTSEAFFARQTKGPITVRWRGAGGKTAEKQVVVLKPTRLVLPIGPAAARR